MRWCVLGAKGMLGQDAVAVLAAAGHEVTGYDRVDVDITDLDATRRAVSGFDVVLNAAAYTAVDDAETAESAAFAVNAVGAAVVARAARSAGARLVHVSTDYVFDGDADVAYAEGAMPAPRSAYGRTKLAGEWAVRAEDPGALVVRTAWLYGAHGPCFPRTIVRLVRERGEVSVVDDQVGQPTWTRDLSALIERLVAADAPGGTYHGSSRGQVTWFGFAQAAVASAGLDPAAVRPTTSQAFPRPAPRPRWSVLGHGALAAAGVQPIEPWDARWGAAAGEVLAGV